MKDPSKYEWSLTVSSDDFGSVWDYLTLVWKVSEDLLDTHTDKKSGEVIVYSALPF